MEFLRSFLVLRRHLEGKPVIASPNVSLRSKRFRLVWEQKKNRGRGFSFLIAREIKREPTPFPALLLAPFFARSLTLVPRSLLLKRTETLATQATKCFLRLRSMFGGSVSAKPP